MNHGTYVCSQYVEVSNDYFGYKETEFESFLDCVTPGCAGQLSGPPEGCYPAEAAEFELDSIYVHTDEGKPILISYQILEAILGEKVAQRMMKAAEQEAIESGEF